jgi:hypothetical protein
MQKDGFACKLVSFVVRGGKAFPSSIIVTLSPQK